MGWWQPKRLKPVRAVRRTTALTGVERSFGDDEIIVSKTDTKGRITYANDVFIRVAGYREAELVGAPHSIIRHPEMPRCVFKFLWDTIEAGDEIFAYVVNMAKNGDHYWVLAHVTPDLDSAGRIVGYHSNRRRPKPEAVACMRDLYRDLLVEEQSEPDRQQGMAKAGEALFSILRSKGVRYDAFVLGL